MMPVRKPYPSDVSDDEWSLVVPYLTLVREDAPQRHHALRELLNALRYVVRYGIAWRDKGVQNFRDGLVQEAGIDQQPSCL